MTAYQAPAKVNLSLLVHPPGRDGYHPIESLAQTVEWCDTLVVEEQDEDVISISGADLDEQDNLVVRARDRMRAKGNVPQLRIDLEKVIPAGAGLAGGSSDAAAVLLACVELARLPRALAIEVAPEIGSDVPLFLIGGLVSMSGIGEIIEPRDPLRDFALAIAVPDFELATPEVYNRWDRLQGPTGEAIPARHLPGSLRDGMPIRNDLTPAALDLEPAMGDFLAELRERWGAPALMTGSGSACFGFFPDLGEAVDAAAAVADACKVAVGVELRSRGVGAIEE